MKTIDRKKFFASLGKGAFVALLASYLPHNFISRAVIKSRSQKINISVHPSAVKRNEKV